MFSDRDLTRPGNFMQPHAPKRSDQDVIESEMELNSFDNRGGGETKKQSYIRHYYCATPSEDARLNQSNEVILQFCHSSDRDQLDYQKA